MRPVFDVDVVPAEAEGFALADAGEDGDGDEGAVPLGGGGDEAADCVAVE